MLEDIKQAIHDCTGCILHKRGGSVPFEGPGTAKIALIGQNPGDEELKDQRPFVGRCGTYLDIALQTAGISRSDLFITNTIKCYIKPGKNTTVVQVSKCKHFVFEELAQVKPKVIVAMGTVAGSLFQSRVLTNTHYYDDALGAWVVFTHHPSRILRTHSVEFDIEFKNSLALAKKLTEDSKETLEKPVVNKITTLEALNQAKVHIMALPEFAFDVGTTGLNFCKDKLVSIGISTDKVCYGIEFKKEMVPALKEIFENQAKKIAQNLKFDWKFLKKEGIEISNITFDTMLAHFIIDPLASSHALEAISLKLFHTSFNKKDINYEEIQSRGITQADVDLYVEREALDAFLTYRVKEILSEKIDAEFKSLYYDFIVPTALLFSNMEYIGVEVDLKQLTDAEMWIDVQLKGIEAELAQMPEVAKMLQKSGLSLFNLNSSKQVGELLYSYLHLPKVRLPNHKKTAAPSTDADTLKEISLRVSNPILDKILEYRNLSKLRTTYCEGIRKALLESGTTRIHTTFSQITTITGRNASSRPNLQTIPIKVANAQDIRAVFIAKPGYVLIDADYGQIEFRVLAHYSHDQAMIDLINSGVDIHKRIASVVLNKPEDQITDEERYLAKSVVFGMMYGRGAYSIAQEFKVPVERAEAIKTEFFNLFPKATQWLTDVSNYAILHKHVKNMFGRIIPILFDSQDPEAVSRARRLAVNYPIQGAASDITNFTGVYLRKIFKEQNIDGNQILNVHDSLIFEVKEEQTDKVKSILETEIPKIKDLLNLRVNLSIKIKVAHSLATPKDK